MFINKKTSKSVFIKYWKITNAQLREIRKEVASGVTPKVLESSTEKYGYDVIVSAFMSSVSVEFVKQESSYEI